MVISPETDIILLKTPFEIDNENNLTFSSKTEQYNYFNSLPKLRLDNATYQRKDNVVRYPGKFDDLIEYNYCMYRNENFSDKWFYAFIEDINFVNPNMTELKLKTDVWNTWQFDIVYKRSFVEREHVNDDTIGLHTIPEQLETGEYVCESRESSSNPNCHAVIVSTYDIVADITKGSDSLAYHTYNGIPNASYYYVVGTDTSYSFLTLALSSANASGKIDGIVGVFLLPDTLLGINNSTNWKYLYATSDGWSTDPSAGLGYCPYITLPNSQEATLMETITINKPYSNVNGYTPKNNKLFTFPYKFLTLDNNNGSATNLLYEMFSSNMSFKIYGDITPGGSVRIIPQNYKNLTENNIEGITGGKYPVGSFTNDVYTNWLTQNGVNIAVSAGSSLLSAGVGAVTGNPIGVASGLLGIASTLGEVYKHSLIPPTIEGNVNSGDVNYSHGLTKFSFYKMSIKQEYAKIIDNFFSAYGYKINNYKIPNITGRRNWNYIKTLSCNIYGDIPQKDLQEIKKLFNNGFTLWHNPSTFLDYSQDNDII